MLIKCIRSIHVPACKTCQKPAPIADLGDPARVKQDVLYLIY